MTSVSTSGSRHVVRFAADAEYRPAPDPRTAPGLTRWTIADETTPGAVHTEFNVCTLQPDGGVATGVQSYEECFYVLEGTPTVQTPDGAARLAPGDYGLLPLCVAHEWRNDGFAPARSC